MAQVSLLIRGDSSDVCAFDRKQKFMSIPSTLTVYALLPKKSTNLMHYFLHSTTSHKTEFLLVFEFINPLLLLAMLEAAIAHSANPQRMFNWDGLQLLNTSAATTWKDGFMNYDLSSHLKITVGVTPFLANIYFTHASFSYYELPFSHFMKCMTIPSPPTSIHS
jgi:hypothetical protein